MAGHDGEKLIGAYVPPSAASAIEKAAAAQGVSKSSLLRKAVTSYLITAKEKRS